MINGLIVSMIAQLAKVSAKSSTPVILDSYNLDYDLVYLHNNAIANSQWFVPWLSHYSTYHTQLKIAPRQVSSDWLVNLTLVLISPNPKLCPQI